MPFIIELDNFQGPFDVLLDLLATKELEITELSLSQVTQDYLDYIAKIELKLEEMNWFLFVATKLTFDKSIAILAIQRPEEDLDLTSALKNYAKIKTQAKLIAEQSKNPLFTRSATELSRPITLCGTEEFLSVYTNIINTYSQKPVSRTISSKSDQLNKTRKLFLEHISKLRDFNSSEILSKSTNRAEAAVYLLTLLEMLRRGELTMRHNQYSMAGIQ